MDDKPSLQLELDEHSADAGVITRLEAFLESLKNYKANRKKRKLEIVDKYRLETLTAEQQKGTYTLFIPYMSDASYAIAACFRAYGQLYYWGSWPNPGNDRVSEKRTVD